MATMDEKDRPKPRRQHSQEFKKGAVSLVLDSGKSVIEVARALGLAESVMFEWVRRAKIERGKGQGATLTGDERAELARLRKENTDLRMERELLKKWAAFFAKENA
jgi:transposase